MTVEVTLAKRRHDERGMATAEYAVGTVATVSFVGIILAIIQSDEFRSFLWSLMQLIGKAVSMFVSGGN